MVIKFVDIEPEDGKPKKPEASKAKPQAETEAAKGSVDREPSGDMSDGELAFPGLTHAKPEPKARGRKKPLK